MSVITMAAGASTVAAIPALLMIAGAWVRNLRGHVPELAATPAWPVIVSPVLVMVPALGLALLVQDDVGYWFGGVTTGAMAGLALLATARALARFGALDTRGAVAIAIVGFLPVSVWLLGISIIGLREHAVPIALGVASAIVLMMASLGASAALLNDRVSSRCIVAVLLLTSVTWLALLAGVLLAA